MIKAKEEEKPAQTIPRQAYRPPLQEPLIRPDKAKEEHVRLADFSPLFTEQFIALALASLKDPGLQRPTFMRVMPGLFRRGKLGLEYVDSHSVSRTFVPQSRRERLLKNLWKFRYVPRGQESFFHYVNKRFIGVQSRFIREFVARQTGIQMVRPLVKIGKNNRAVRGKVPFSHISCDLADMISFSDAKGREAERFVFLLCDDFSGYLFARLLPDGKKGPGVAHAFERILGKIKKLGGRPRILTSDLGTEFFNKHFQAVVHKNTIKHIKPIRVRMAPYIENRVRHFKKYVRLLSKLLFENTFWYEKEVIRDACKSVNNIQRDSGFSAHEIVVKWKKKETLEPITESYKKEEKPDVRVGVPNMAVGDFVRVRVAKQKLSLAHKSHLGFYGDDLEIPVNWSMKIYRILKTRNLRVRRTVRFFLSNKQWYDRTELLKIPANTKEYTRMPRTIPEKEVLPGRSSRLGRKKRITYKE